MIDEVIARLRSSVGFVGVSFHFDGAELEGIRTWPVIPKCNNFVFEISTLLAGDADVYWGTNHFIPRSTKLPSVVTIHDMLLIRFPGEQRLSHFLANRMLSSVRRASKVVTDSKTTANDLLALCPEARSKVEVVQLGYRGSNIIERPSLIDQQVDKYVVMLGAHRPRKNLTVAINAVGTLRERGMNLRLIVTGDVHPSFSLDMARNSAFVEGTGVLSQDELSRRLQESVALLFPSTYEGFGFPILEAMAAGCPVIALDTPINRETSGDGAILLPHDPVKWGSAIESLVRSASLRAEMQARGFQNLQRFSWQTTAATYEQLFSQVRSE